MNRQYDKNFGKVLRRLREGKKLTQELLSVKMQIAGCDITRSALAKIKVAQRHVYPDEHKALKETPGVECFDIFVFEKNAQ